MASELVSSYATDLFQPVNHPDDGPILLVQNGKDTMATNINRIILTGNLTVDPELRATASGTSVCHLRLACNTRRKDSTTGEWGDRPNYFNVVVWGTQGENAARYLAKGRPVAVDGRLEWREWETQEGAKRQAVDVVADSIQFLGSPSEAPVTDAAFDQPDFAPLPAGQSPEGDPDIPF